GLGGELVISAHPVRQFGDQVGFVHVGIPLRVRYAGAVPVRAELDISILTWFRHTGVFRRLLRNDFLSHDQRGVVTGLDAGRRLSNSSIRWASRSVRPMSSSPSMRRHRVLSSMSNGTVTSPAVTVRDPRSTVSSIPG